MRDEIARLNDDLKYNEEKFGEVLSQQEAEYDISTFQAKQAASRRLDRELRESAIKVRLIFLCAYINVKLAW